MTKPWPADAVMIVCELPHRACRSNMSTIEPAECRDCGAALVVDGASVAAATANPLRQDRPIDFFCIECAIGYDLNSIDHLTDMRESGSERRDA